MENIVNRMIVLAYRDKDWSFFDYMEYDINWADVSFTILDLHDNSQDLFRTCIPDKFALRFHQYLDLSWLDAAGLLSDRVKSELAEEIAAGYQLDKPVLVRLAIESRMSRRTGGDK